MKILLLALITLSSLNVMAEDPIISGKSGPIIYSEFYDTGLTIKAALSDYKSQKDRKIVCDKFGDSFKKDLETFKGRQNKPFDYELKSRSMAVKYGDNVGYFCQVDISLIGNNYRFQKQSTEKFLTVDGAVEPRTDLNIIARAKKIRSSDSDVLNFFSATSYIRGLGLKWNLKYFKIVPR